MDPLRQRLIRETTHLFVERGFDGTSMREIADACGVTKASLYYYYPSKADILADIVRTYLEAVSAAVVEGRGAGPTPSAQLRAIVAQLFTLPPEGRAVIRLAMHDLHHLAEPDRAAFGEAYDRQFLQPIAEIVAAGIASGEFESHEPMTVVWALLGMLYPFLSRPPSAATSPQLVDELLALLLDGLNTRRF